MTSYDESQLRLTLMAHLNSALDQAKQLPDREFIVYLLELAQIEAGPKYHEDRAPLRKVN